VIQLEGLLNINPLHFAELSDIFQKYDLIDIIIKLIKEWSEKKDLDIQ
jgi:hypothetical protein